MENAPQGRGRARGRARTATGDLGADQERSSASASPPQAEGLQGPNPVGGGGESESYIVASSSVRGSMPRGGPASSRDVTVAEVATEYVATIPTYEGFDKHGKLGNPVNLIANFFELRKHPKFQMCLYSVKTEPPTEDEKKIRYLVRTKRADLGPYLQTGFNLFTTLEIREELLTFQAMDKDVVYFVKLDLVRQVDGSEPLVIQFYNSVIRHAQRLLKFELLGRHFYNPMAKQGFPNWKLELWPGFQNTIRQQEKALMLNVESVWKVVRTESILELMSQIRQEFGAGPEFQQRCNQEFIGLTVITMYNNKAYRIDRIDYNSNPKSTFETTVKDEEGIRRPVTKTFQDYYRDRYGKNITNLGQPMLVSEPRARDIRRGQVSEILLIPQFCYPCGLKEEMRSNFRLMKDLAGCLHMQPTERVDTFTRLIQSVVANTDIVEVLKSWGLKVNPEPVKVEGRRFPAEKLSMANNQEICGDDKGDWTTGLRGVNMTTTIPLTKWVIVVSNRDAGNVANLISTMTRVANPLGYRIAQPEIQRIQSVSGEAFTRGITEAVQNARGQLDMIFVVLPNNNLENYSIVKKLCSVKHGIPSQCFLAKNLNAKGLMSICTKMVIQMNAKQGGEPWCILNPLKTVMVLGYDVHHAGAGSGGRSIGAMTATTSPSLGTYYSTVAPLNTERQEIGTIVASMFEKCLEAYFQKNKVYPERIFMYRDGVAENQLREVVNTEVSGFKERIARLYGEKNVAPAKLTYVIVNKRINTRFFATRSAPGGRATYENPLPGTIVDNVVTRPERYDFFLISATARQGCVSPTHYNVIHDENQLGADKLQRFTYKLCHLYYNWTGTVAVPATCQNAHKYALQAGTALKGRGHANLEHLLHYL